MPETLTPQEDLVTRNIDTLRSAEYGYMLQQVYEAALDIDPRLENVDIVPLPDDTPSIARALPAWHSPNGRHQVEIGMSNVDETLQKITDAMDAIPGARELFAHKIGILPEEVTPEVMYVFSLAHELGHVSEWIDHEEDPSALMHRNRAEKMALPLAGVAISAMRQEGSRVNTAIKNNWDKVSEATGAKSFEELLGIQHEAYRDTTSERIADDFASMIMAANPVLVDQLSGPDRTQYRDLPLEVYG